MLEGELGSKLTGRHVSKELFPFSFAEYLKFTASKMLKPLGVASASTVTQWCEWIEKAYLFFFVPIFSDSAKSRLLNPKKVYCVDTGLECAVSSRRIPNDGARFENLVYLALRRGTKDVVPFWDWHP